MLTNDGFMEAFSIAFLQERVNDLSEQNVINGVYIAFSIAFLQERVNDLSEQNVITRVYIATPLIQVTAFVVRKLSHSNIASSSLLYFFSLEV